MNREDDMKTVVVDIKDITNLESFQENYSKGKSYNSASTFLTNQITTYTESDQDNVRNSYFPRLFRTGAELRMAYIEKLIKQAEKNEENNLLPSTGYNSIILFDWDDTLLPSHFIDQCLSQGKQMTVQMKEVFTKMEFAVIRLLSLAINHGDVYIVTNATAGWVEYSASIYYPSLAETLQKVKVISARSAFENKFPNNLFMWKMETFKAIRKYYQDIVTNVLCIGDSMFELDAARKMCSEFKEAFCKCIKVKETPKPEQITKQLLLLADNFSKLHGMISNTLIQIGNKVK